MMNQAAGFPPAAVEKQSQVCGSASEPRSAPRGGAFADRHIVAHMHTATLFCILASPWRRWRVPGVQLADLVSRLGPHDTWPEQVGMGYLATVTRADVDPKIQGDDLSATAYPVQPFWETRGERLRIWAMAGVKTRSGIRRSWGASPAWAQDRPRNSKS